MKYNVTHHHTIVTETVYEIEADSEDAAADIFDNLEDDARDEAYVYQNIILARDEVVGVDEAS